MPDGSIEKAVPIDVPCFFNLDDDAGVERRCVWQQLSRIGSRNGGWRLLNARLKLAWIWPPRRTAVAEVATRHRAACDRDYDQDRNSQIVAKFHSAGFQPAMAAALINATDSFMPTTIIAAPISPFSIRVGKSLNIASAMR